MLDGTAAAMHDAGVAISSVSCVQFITTVSRGQHYVECNASGYVPVANPFNLRMVFDEILPIL